MGLILHILSQVADFVIIGVGLSSGLYTLVVVQENTDGLKNLYVGGFLQCVATCGLLTSFVLPPVVVLARHLGDVSCTLCCVLVEGLVTVVGAAGGAGILLVPALEAVFGTPTTPMGHLLRFIPSLAGLVAALHGLVYGLIDVGSSMVRAQHANDATNETEEGCAGMRTTMNSQWSMGTVDTIAVLSISLLLLVFTISVTLVALRKPPLCFKKEDTCPQDPDIRHYENEEHGSSMEDTETNTDDLVEGAVANVTVINSRRGSSCSQGADIVVRIDQTDIKNSSQRPLRKSDVSSVRIGGTPVIQRSSQFTLPGTVNKSIDHSNFINVTATVRRRHNPKTTPPSSVQPIPTGRHTPPNKKTSYQCSTTSHDNNKSHSSDVSFFSLKRNRSSSKSTYNPDHSLSSCSTFSIGGPAAKYVTGTTAKTHFERGGLLQEAGYNSTLGEDQEAETASCPQRNIPEVHDNSSVLERPKTPYRKSNSDKQEQDSLTRLNVGTSLKGNNLSSFSNYLSPIQPGPIQKKLTWSSARQAICSVENIPVQTAMNFPLPQKRSGQAGWMAPEDNAREERKPEGNFPLEVKLRLNSPTKSYTETVNNVYPPKEASKDETLCEAVRKVRSVLPEENMTTDNASFNKQDTIDGGNTMNSLASFKGSHREAGTDNASESSGRLDNIQVEEQHHGNMGLEGGEARTYSSGRSSTVRSRRATPSAAQEKPSPVPPGPTGVCAEEHALLRASLSTMASLVVLLTAAGVRLVWGPACHSSCTWWLHLVDSAQRLALVLTPVLYLHTSDALHQCLDVIANH